MTHRKSISPEASLKPEGISPEAFKKVEGYRDDALRHQRGGFESISVGTPVLSFFFIVIQNKIMISGRRVSRNG